MQRFREQNPHTEQKKTTKENLFYLFIYLCLYIWRVFCVCWHFILIMASVLLKGKNTGPIKLLYTVSNYSCMHIIHVINYLRIYKEQLFCRKIGDTCHAQYRETHTLLEKNGMWLSTQHISMYTVHVFYNDGKFSPVPILWQFVYGAFFHVLNFCLAFAYSFLFLILNIIYVYNIFHVLYSV